MSAGVFRLTELLVAVLVLTVSPSSICHAEVADSAKVGDTVRVTAPSLSLHRKSAVVLRKHVGSMTIITRNPSRQVVVDQTEMTELLVQRGRREEVLESALLFGGLGACVGAVIGYASPGYNSRPADAPRDERWKGALSTAAAIGAVGICVGVIFGQTFKRPRWVLVALGGDLGTKNFEGIGLRASVNF